MSRDVPISAPEAARIDAYSRRAYPKSWSQGATHWTRTSLTHSAKGWAVGVMGGCFSWKAKASTLTVALDKLDAQIAETERNYSQ